MTDHDDAAIDLSICNREPIAFYEYIQSFGFLLALAKDWTIVRASANLEEHLGISASDAIGTKLSDLVGENELHTLRNRMAMLSTTGSERLFGQKLIDAHAPFDLNLHMSGDLLVLEGEPSSQDDSTEAALMVRTMMARLVKQTSLDAFHKDAARQVRAITGYDRVMIYAFDADGAGEVIAEAVRPGVESFLGLRFPASDIPPHVRALALRSRFRIIPDIAAAPASLIPAGVAPLDQSLAITRGVAPVHIEYLGNMGVAASISISIVVDGKLWGLITCNHLTPRLPGFVMRTSAELFVGMYSMTLENRVRQTSADEDMKAHEVGAQLIEAVTENEILLSDPAWLMILINDMIAVDGVVICREGEVFRHGWTPDAHDIAALCKYLDAQPSRHVLDTDRLAALVPGLKVRPSDAAGLLAIPVSRRPGDYFLLFRREMLRRITWSGDPVKAMTPTEDGLRLSPRKSFAAFSELVRGKSVPFSVLDRRHAETIRTAMIEVILQLSEAVTDRRPVLDRQELLIAELNHRVRNILSLVRGLITQSETDAHDVASYVASLGGRVLSLARAHDQVTRQNYGPSLLNALFDAEIAAHGRAASKQFSVEGPSIMLQPLAITTLALVIHELVTNSVKYGALSADGRVSVIVERVANEGLWLHWRETGGPAVQAPTRRGFGSVVVERFVPYDLGGSATVRYDADGFEADFFIPEEYVCVTPAIGALWTGPQAPASAATAVVLHPLNGLHVLLLEDNLLIAMEAEDMLHGLGAASVTAVSTIKGAQAAMAERSFDFAMLDINVGARTSFNFALRLKLAGVPYVFASGYGNQVALEADHTGAVVIQKPYEQAHLAVAIEAAFALLAAV